MIAGLMGEVWPLGQASGPYGARSAAASSQAVPDGRRQETWMTRRRPTPAERRSPLAALDLLHQRQSFHGKSVTQKVLHPLPQVKH